MNTLKLPNDLEVFPNDLEVFPNDLELDQKMIEIDGDSGFQMIWKFFLLNGNSSLG